MAKSTPEEYLAGLDPNLLEIAVALRKMVRYEIPNAIEMVDSASHLIGYGFDKGYKGLICAIVPQHGYVTLMLSRGAELSDPEGLLEGTGKRARHVKVRSVEVAATQALRSLLKMNADLVGNTPRGGT
jgi:hypothetical protein